MFKVKNGTELKQSDGKQKYSTRTKMIVFVSIHKCNIQDLHTTEIIIAFTGR